MEHPSLKFKQIIKEQLPTVEPVQSFTEKLDIIKQNNRQIVEALQVFDDELTAFTSLQVEVLELLKARLLKLKG